MVNNKKVLLALSGKIEVFSTTKAERKEFPEFHLHPNRHDWRTAMSGKEPLKIVNIDRIDGDALIVTYSNDTTAIYTTEQIVALTPQDLRSEEDYKDSSTEPSSSG
jgi:hypothetical protein